MELLGFFCLLIWSASVTRRWKEEELVNTGYLVFKKRWRMEEE